MERMYALVPLTDIARAEVIPKSSGKDSSGDSQLTDVRVVSGPEGPPGWPVSGSQHQDREQRRCDGLEPGSGQQHPPVESLHREGGLKESYPCLSSGRRSRGNNFARREHAEYNRFSLILTRLWRALSRLLSSRFEIVLQLTPYHRECVNSALSPLKGAF